MEGTGSTGLHPAIAADCTRSVGNHLAVNVVGDLNGLVVITVLAMDVNQADERMDDAVLRRSRITQPDGPLGPAEFTCKAEDGS